MANMVFTASRSAGDDINIPISIPFTVGGTATFTSDYTVTGANSFTANSGSMTILAGQTSASITISTVPDSILEPNETIILTPTAQAGSWVVGTSAWTGTILNDDGGTSLTYVSDGDANGLIYFLGTNSLTSAFSNPVTNGAILVAASSTTSATPPDVLTNRVSDGWFSTDSVNSWVAWDLNRMISISKYTIRNRPDPDRSPQNWILEGTNTISAFTLSGLNAATWTPIDTRTNDATLTTAAQYYTLTANGSTASYRYLRMRNFGNNSRGPADNYFTLNEIEFYGLIS